MGGEQWRICEESCGLFFSSVREAPAEQNIKNSSTHYGMPSLQGIKLHRSCRGCFRESVGMKREEIENALPPDTVIDKLTCCYCYGLFGLSSDALNGFADHELDTSNHGRRCIPCYKRYRAANRLSQEFYLTGKRFRACACDHWPEDQGEWHTAIYQGIVGLDVRYRKEVDICNACYHGLTENTELVNPDSRGYKYKLVPRRHRLPDLWRVEDKKP